MPQTLTQIKALLDAAEAGELSDEAGGSSVAGANSMLGHSLQAIREHGRAQGPAPTISYALSSPHSASRR